MLEISARRRGRPPGSTVRHPDFCAEVWISVQFYRIRIRMQTGKTPSVRNACGVLAAEGGFVSIVGGNTEALVKANSNSKKRLTRFEINSNGSDLSPNAAGTIFANHIVNNPDTLAARYSDANQIARSNYRIRKSWMDLCWQRLGWPARNARRQVSPRNKITH